MLSERIREARKAAKLTQSDLAKILECTKQTVYTYEKGLTPPPLPVLEKIASATERPVKWFFEESDRHVKLYFASQEVAAQADKLQQALDDLYENNVQSSDDKAYWDRGMAARDEAKSFLKPLEKGLVRLLTRVAYIEEFLLEKFPEEIDKESDTGAPSSFQSHKGDMESELIDRMVKLEGKTEGIEDILQKRVNRNAGSEQ